MIEMKVEISFADFNAMNDELIKLRAQNKQLEQSVKNATAKVAELTERLEHSKKREMRHYNACKEYRMQIAALEGKIDAIKSYLA